MGISERTLNNWKQKYPEFKEALNVGKIDPDDKVERSLYERAVGYFFPTVKIFKVKGEPPCIVRFMEHVPPDVTAQIFYLKNRRPKIWRDRHELTGEGGAPIAITFSNHFDGV